MRCDRTRVLAVGGLATGTAAAFVAVLAGFGAEPVGGVAAAQATLTSRTVSFGTARVQVQRLPSGIVCFRVIESAGSSRACRASVGAREIGYTISPRGIGGVAGPQVRAVIVKLTRLGTVWARADRGAFYADVPPAYRVRAVVKVLRDGSRKTFAVKGPDA
jgi:hypothetical protein